MTQVTVLEGKILAAGKTGRRVAWPHCVALRDRVSVVMGMIEGRPLPESATSIALHGDIGLGSLTRQVQMTVVQDARLQDR